MFGYILGLIVVGLIAGAIARFLVPGRHNISIPMTIVLGVVGSFVGGFLGYLLFRKDGYAGFFQPSGIFGSIVGSILVLLLWVKYGNKSGSRR